MAKLDSSGNLLSFNPDLNNVVRTLAIDKWGNIYAGGLFTKVGMSDRFCFAKFNQNEMLLNVNLFSYGPIYAITTDRHGNYYIGGETSFYKFDSVDQLTIFNPGINLTVFGIHLDLNNNLYICGNFTIASGTSKQYIAKYNSDGTLNNFSPNINGILFNVSSNKNGNLFFGGTFNLINITQRNNLAKFDYYGNLTDFNPTINGTISAIKTDEEGNIFIGGTFNNVNYVNRNNIAKLNNAGILMPFQANINGLISAIELKNNKEVFLGGKFVLVNDSIRNNFAKLDSSGKILPLIFNFNDEVKDIKIDKENRTYIAGNFTTVNEIPRNYFAILNNDETLNAVSHQINNNINTIAITNTYYFLGGMFSQVNSVTRNNFVKFNFEHQIKPLSFQFNGNINSILVDSEDNIFVGGAFTRVGNLTREYLVRINKNDSLTNDNFNFNSFVSKLSYSKYGVLHIGGNFINRYFSIRTCQTQPPFGNSNQTFCKTAFISDLSLNNQNIFWYSSLKGGIPLNTNLEIKSGNTYYASAKNGCESFERFRVNASILNISKKITVNGNNLISQELNAEYQWLDCNNGYSIIENANQNSFTPTKNGKYAVRIKKLNCIDTSECININVIGLIENFENDVKIYPNPNNGNFTIECSTLEILDFKVKDIIGNEINASEFKTINGFHIKITEPQGIYILEVRLKNYDIVNYKIIKF